jgi:hypothetical protein
MVEDKATEILHEQCWWDIQGDIPTIARYMASEEIALEMGVEESLKFLGLSKLQDATLHPDDKRLLKRFTAVVLRNLASLPA